MQGNNNNENQGWKSKLDGLESLSAEEFDLQASWQKLESRREKPPRKKKAAWYWLAAACLLIVISLPFFFNSARNIEPMVKQATPVKNIEQPVTNGNADTNNVIAVVSSSEIKIISKSQAQSIVSPKKDEPVLQKDTILKEADLVVSTILSTVTDTLKLMAAAPVKKKLKVVPYNELVGSTDSLTGDSRPYFPVKFRTKEIYTNNTGSGKDNIIRIKISSQN